MTLYIDHIEADEMFSGIPGERKKVSHEAILQANLDDVMAFIRRKIENADGVRVLYTEQGQAYYLFTGESVNEN